MLNNQIEVNEVSVKYGNHIVLDRVTFKIVKGDYIGLVGANGSGKTSLVKAMLGLVQLESGSVKYQNPDMKKGY